MVVATVADGEIAVLETGDAVDGGTGVAGAAVIDETVADDCETVDSSDGDGEEFDSSSPHAATRSRPVRRTNRPRTVRRILPEMDWDC